MKKKEKISKVKSSNTVRKQKNAEEPLRQSEERYRTILENMQEGYFEVDLAGNFIFFNDSLCRIHKRSKDEMMRMNNRQYMDKETSKKAFEAFNRVYKTGEPLPEVHWKIVRKDGVTRYIEASVSLMKDSSGKPIGFRGITRDITERKKAEQLLLESAAMLQITIDEAPVCVAMVDFDKRFIKCNKAFCTFLGYSEKEIQQKTIADITFLEDLEIGMADLRAIVAGEKKSSIVHKRYVRKDNAVVWGETNINLIRNNQGKPMYFLPIIIDITDRKQAEEELKESEDKFRTIFENSASAMAIIERDTTISMVNKEYCRVGLYEENDVIGMSWTKQIPSEDLKRLEEYNRERLINPKNAPSNYEFSFYRKDGEIRNGLISIAILPNSQKIVASFVDITERKKAEEALRESEDLYRTIFENTGTSMILIEEDMTISMANEEFVRNTGYSADEINGRMKWTEIIHPDDLGRMIEQHRLRRESHGGALPSYEFRYITKTGDLKDTLLTIKLVPGTKKSIASLIDITERKKAEDKLQQTLKSLRKAVGTTIQVLVSAVESRDSYTAGHQSRSADLACAIAMEMGLAQEKIEGILMAGIIHDIGKLSIPAEILSKPTKLTNLEFSLIKEHSRSGHEMLKDVESPWPLAEIVYQHHERMNGSGYPRNLKGDEILLESRILAVADVVEAMASHRPYRPTLGIEAAIEEIEKNRGILYDNTVADACLRLFREKCYQLK